MKKAPFAAAAALALSAVACSDSAMTTEPVDPRLSSHRTAIDVGGSWSWNSTEHLTFPAWVAELVFGIAPEGPVTTARCENTGTLSLVQIGAAFSGTSVRTAHQCETRGGQLFVDATSFVPAAVEGEVTGRSVRFTQDGIVVDCDYHAVASRVSGNVAQELSGGSTCTLPGHPQSAFDVPPPPGGTSKAISWSAVRP